ncbi:hypothetical protein Gasu2_69990 [Galdieria sulphuraria]|nr:hypothetical protein Gasu2_69990 [Galdieria sulphuraria]
MDTPNGKEKEINGLSFTQINISKWISPNNIYFYLIFQVRSRFATSTQTVNGLVPRLATIELGLYSPWRPLEGYVEMSTRV